MDDQFRSLMEGLRTSLPAVQVLFAFLLIAPLQAEFSDFEVSERIAFSIAFYSAGVASMLLVAPSVHQRVRAPFSGLTRRSKQHLIWTTWITIAGSVLMAASVLSTVFLVSSLIFDGLTAAITTVVMAIIVGWSWFYVPLVTYRSPD